MMDRRRALMGAQGESGDTHLLYSLYNYVFNMEYISTGVEALSSDISVTILLDINITSNPTSGNGSTTKLIRCGTGFNLGKKSGYDTYYQIQTMTTWSGSNVGITTTSSEGRKRFAITHEAGSNDFYIKAKMGTDQPTQTIKTATFVPRTNILFFGAATADLLTTGTINKAEVYDRILSQEELDAFFA